MIKRFFTTFLLSIMLFSMVGCYNYLGLDKLTIVAGIAIDMDKEANEYLLTFEVIDFVKSSSTKGIFSILIESKGHSIFDAVTNAKKRINHKLYFGNAETLIISNKIASEDGITDILDYFIRNEYTRETMFVVISKEENASDILKSKSLTNNIISYDINFMVQEDQEITNETKVVQLYQLYNYVKEKGIYPVLPAFHITKNEDMDVIELDGLAVFGNGEKQIGYLTSDESKYYLFLIDEMKAGNITINTMGKKIFDITLDVVKNKTKKSFTNNDNKIKFTFEIDTIMDLVEKIEDDSPIDSEKLSVLKAEATQELNKRIYKVMNKIQKELKSDILGLGNSIYKKDFKFWRKIEDDWDEIFENVEIEIKNKVNINNTAFRR